MEKQMQVQEQKQAHANRTAAILAIGGGIGAAIGLVASYIFIKNIAEVDDKQFTPMTGVKLGLAVMGLLRILAG